MQTSIRQQKWTLPWEAAPPAGTQWYDPEGSCWWWSWLGKRYLGCWKLWCRWPAPSGSGWRRWLRPSHQWTNCGAGAGPQCHPPRLGSACLGCKDKWRLYGRTYSQPPSPMETTRKSFQVGFQAGANQQHGSWICSWARRVEHWVNLQSTKKAKSVTLKKIQTLLWTKKWVKVIKVRLKV